MSLLAEVAARADVPVEGVVRVVTRQPVSRRIEQRVVDVLGSLSPEQLRLLERLARAATPGVVARVDVDQGDSRSVARVVDDVTAGNSASDGLPLRLARVLDDVVTRLDELRRDHVTERQERVDDLSVLVDLVTTGLQGVDRRLARLERTIAALEAPPELPPRLSGGTAAEERRTESAADSRPAPATAGATVAEPEPALAEAAPGRPTGRRWRWWLVPAASLLAVSGLAVAFLAIELFASPADEPRLGPSLADTVAPQTSLSATTGGAGGLPLQQPPAPAALPSASEPSRTLAPPPPDAAGRVLAWPRLPGATYYLVRIVRDGELVHAARPSAPRLVLPASVDWKRGRYRWSVRAGLGARSERRLGATIVDSTLTVGG